MGIFECDDQRHTNILKVRDNSTTLEAITVSSRRPMAHCPVAQPARLKVHGCEVVLIVHLGPVGAGTARRVRTG